MPTQGFQYTLPGEWWSVPLDVDPQERASTIHGLVRSRYGKRDDLAQLRADHKARLVQASEAALAGGATQFFVSVANDAGVAFASTLTEYCPQTAFGTRAEPELVAEHVVRALHRDAASDGTHWAALEAAGGAAFAKGTSTVVRSITRRERDPGNEQNDEQSSQPSDDSFVASLTVDYWATVPGSTRVVLTSFSNSLLALEPLMIELFDRIIAASSWHSEASGGGLREQLLARHPHDKSSLDDAGSATAGQA